MNPTTISLITFLAASVAVALAGMLVMELVLRNRSRISKRVQDAFPNSMRDRGRKTSLFKDLKFIQTETAESELGLWQRLRLVLDQSGVNMAPDRLLAVSLLAGTVAGILGGVLARHWLIGIAAGTAGCLAPGFYVYHRRNVRVQKLRGQLPGAFEMMSRAVRAGQTMSGAIQLAVEQCKPPLADEFRLCCDQQNLGLPPDVAFKNLARRTGVIELQIFVVAMLVQRQSGGNPVEVLNNLASVVRKRVRMMGKVKVLTGEGRMQAVVLSALPVVAFIALFLLNRPYVQILLDRPQILWGIVASEIVGSLWIRKIINFDY